MRAVYHCMCRWLVALAACRAGEGRLAERGFKRGGGVSDDRAYSSARPAATATAGAAASARLPACPPARLFTEELAIIHVNTSPPCFPAEALKGVRTVKFEDLPDDVIQAARRRRQRDVERCAAPLGSAGRPVCPGSAPVAGSQRVLQGGAPICRGCCLPLLLHQSPQHAPACSCTCACLRLTVVYVPALYIAGTWAHWTWTQLSCRTTTPLP
jgi:hypothetical protein